MYELEDLPELAEVSEEEKQEFTINDDLKADWACKIIKQEEAEKNRLQQIIDDEIAILQAKKEKLEQQFINNTGFLRMKLNDFFNTVEKKELKTCLKYKLPSAELVFTKPKVKYERDNNKILQWLNDNNKYDFIKVTHSVDWENLKQQDFLNQVDGITETMTEARFEVK
jgi:hypothetical protein